MTTAIHEKIWNLLHKTDEEGNVEHRDKMGDDVGEFELSNFLGEECVKIHDFVDEKATYKDETYSYERAALYEYKDQYIVFEFRSRCANARSIVENYDNDFVDQTIHVIEKDKFEEKDYLCFVPRMDGVISFYKSWVRHPEDARQKFLDYAANLYECESDEQ